MNYIYDVILNFKKNYYDFFEWNKEDDITHIRKIPSFKVSNEDYVNLKYNTLKINEVFFDKLFNKTEKFMKNDIKKIKNSCIFSDGKDVIAISFDNNRMNNFKSSLAIDEQDDIIDIIKYYKETKLEYELIEKNKVDFFKTRFECENAFYIKNQLDKIYCANDYKKLSYIHLECFGYPEKNIDKAISKIKKEIAKGNDNFYKIFNFFKNINQK